ncbi:MAG TPA: hypothetical protein VGC72_10765 [Candidatus Elarobacter sp.]
MASIPWRRPLLVFGVAAFASCPTMIGAESTGPIVRGGHAQLVRPSEKAISDGFEIPAGARITTADVGLRVAMPDGTKLTVGHQATVQFAGLGSTPGIYSLDVTRGEIALDTSGRARDAVPMRYRVTTPLNTVITFRATSGNIIVRSTLDRIECNVCAAGDFKVRSLGKEVALDEPGAVATVTLDKGVVVATNLYRYAVALTDAKPASGGAFASPASPGALRVNEVALQLRDSGGDRSSVAVCPAQHVRLTAVGGRPPYRAASTNGSVADVLNSYAAPKRAAYSYALKAGIPGDSEITVMDEHGKSALVALHVLKSTSHTCQVYRDIDVDALR